MNSQLLLTLETSLASTDLDCSIYNETPSQFIRFRPQSNLTSSTLSKALSYLNTQLVLKPTQTAGIYQVITGSVGAYIQGRHNPFFERDYVVQDYASVAPVLALDVQPGQQVLDMCSAPGMKALLLYDLAPIELTCVEKNSKRFTNLLTRLPDSVRAIRTDATQLNSGMYDRILLDVPCSGTGITQKYDPRTRRRVSGFADAQKAVRNMNSLQATQYRLLTKAFEHLLPDGKLVYSTCALGREENEDVLRQFLNKTPGAVVLPISAPIDLPTLPADYGVRIRPGITRGQTYCVIGKR